MTRTEEIRPTTLTGVKRLAKTIKKERGISHNEALKIAARQAGWLSYIEAVRNMPT